MDQGEPTADQLRSVLAFAKATARRMGLGSADADEIAQLTVIKLYQRWHTVSVRSAVAADGVYWRNFVAKTARRTALDLFRSEDRRRGRELKASGAEGGVTVRSVPPTVDPELLLAQQLLLDTIDALPESLRNVARLAFVEEHNSNEIAEALGIKPRAVRHKREQARVKLSRILGRFGPDDDDDVAG